MVAPSGASSDPSDAPAVHVAGAPGVGKTSLICGIKGSSETLASGSYPWQIRTKYYTAHAQLVEASAQSSTGAQPEALLLVFSLKDSSTFSFVEQYVRTIDLEAIEIKLLCGTHADALLPADGDSALEVSSQPDWIQSAFSWSIDNGFEFVTCSPAHVATDERLRMDGDRQGVARVVEALHAHAWPNLELAGSGNPNDGDVAVAHERSDRERECSGSQEASQGGSNLSPITAPHGAVGTEAAGGGQAQQAYSEEGSRQDVAADQRPQELQAPGPDEAAATGLGSGPHTQPHQQQQAAAPRGEQQREQPRAQEKEAERRLQQEERSLDGLERLMADMMAHKARVAGLPDGERREQAAAFALRMLEMMGSGSEGEGSEEGDEE